MKLGYPTVVCPPFSPFFYFDFFFYVFSLFISKIVIFQQRMGVRKPEGCPGFNSLFAFVSFR